jgi:hypothetical protein
MRDSDFQLRWLGLSLKLGCGSARIVPFQKTLNLNM